MKPHVLLVNDDGPPSPSSPYVLQLYRALVEHGWSVRVVLPSSQKSWSGTTYTVSQREVRYWYYYPLKDNFTGTDPGTAECWSDTRRAIDYARGEIAEWVLVDGSPSTCTNVGLFTGDALFGCADAGACDLVVSGPNFGRNSGTAFAVSSGTLGAALAGSLCDVRSVAISYGHFATNPPTLEPGPGRAKLDEDEAAEAAALACQHSVTILQQLWDQWDRDADVQAYSINVPLAETLREPQVRWHYPLPTAPDRVDRTPPLGIPITGSNAHDGSYLVFRPDLRQSLRPPEPDLEPGTDAWAMCKGIIGIARLRAGIAEVIAEEELAPPSCT
ncbi:hypothetical protein MSPP1_000695 [Malassezia sp. CBS 17886]|nr:hypothetical protein MSPP1_000695 [Malassezia sp. CBS 17886]